MRKFELVREYEKPFYSPNAEQVVLILESNDEKASLMLFDSSKQEKHFFQVEKENGVFELKGFYYNENDFLKIA